MTFPGSDSDSPQLSTCDLYLRVAGNLWRFPGRDCTKRPAEMHLYWLGADSAGAGAKKEACARLWDRPGQRPSTPVAGPGADSRRCGR